MDILILIVLFSLLIFFTYQANRNLSSIRTGYLLLDLPVISVVLSITLLYEVIVSLLPIWARSKQKLNGKIALVTGAGSGIGKATSIQLSKEGCILILWDINKSGNEETQRMIECNGGKAFAYTVDVSDRKALEQTAETVIQEHTRVDILVCNAGIVNISRLHKLGNDRIDKLVTVNFISIVWLTKFFLKRMVEHDYGHIICTSSMSALRGTSHTCDYATSKAALSNYFISLTGDLDIINCKTVNVSVVYPIAVRTPLVQKVIDAIPELYCLNVGYVARQIVDGILLKKEFILIPQWQKIVNLLNFLMPVTFLNYIIKELDIERVAAEFDKYTDRTSHLATTTVQSDDHDFMSSSLQLILNAYKIPDTKSQIRVSVENNVWHVIQPYLDSRYILDNNPSVYV
ncbi:Estradiol 17-beta-dehydrogenase 11-like [Oopsacas minuta]|uniref:Estradiol 17-beta-dehydrogenase 11-like n=1 Tax=Oopsacas minuta TaxID=111878 RepID=A0AAV7K3G7_9METZ|nr:Estradiol 17-beta-dehydrogenase 11-like [Oopsacas minuta]